MRGLISYPARPTFRYARHLAERLRTETAGGMIMLAATAIALTWANSPWQDTYENVRTAELDILGLELSFAEWSSAGLLTLFFFVAGLEVKEEIVHGDLRSPRNAVLPIAAALGGMVVPVLLYLAVSWDDRGGWAVPMATDIAFALAVLAVTASALPSALRAFLLTMAVIDDLAAISVIALFYSEKLDLLPLLGAAALLAVYGWLQRRRFSGLWLYVPIALAAWVCVELSGVHATVAGVALALLTRCSSGVDEDSSPAERADHFVRPLSAGLAVPLFAFTAAGVTLGGSALGGVLTDRIAIGVILGLVIGKFLGVFGGAWLAVRLGLARISEELFWRDVASVSALAGVGFTVSLLIGGLAYAGPDQSERVATAVLIASLVASVVAALSLRVRVRHHRSLGDDTMQPQQGTETAERSQA